MYMGSVSVRAGRTSWVTFSAKEDEGEEGVSRLTGTRASFSMVARSPKWESDWRSSLNLELSSWEAVEREGKASCQHHATYLVRRWFRGKGWRLARYGRRRPLTYLIFLTAF
jgi:hypothetical protein